MALAKQHENKAAKDIGVVGDALANAQTTFRVAL